MSEREKSIQDDEGSEDSYEPNTSENSDDESQSGRFSESSDTASNSSGNEMAKMKQTTVRETSLVKSWRLAVVAALVLVGIVVSTGCYLYLKKQQTAAYEQNVSHVLVRV
jgi:hypothetical protein